MRDEDQGGLQLARATHTTWQQPMPDLQELIADLWRRRLLILIVAIIVLAVAVPPILLREPVWRAEAKVAIDGLQPQVTGANTTMSRFEDGALETEIQIMRSRELVEQVIEQLGLDGLPDFNPLLQPPSSLQAFKTWLLGLVKPWLPAGDPVDDMVAISPLTLAVEQFLQNLETAPIGHSQVIAVSLRSTNRARVADAVNTLVAAYLSAQTMARRELMARVGADLEAHTEELAERVRASEQALEKFRAESGLIRGPDISLRTQGMVNLTTLLAEATAERATAESKLAQLRRGGGAAYAVPEVLNAPHIGRMLEEEAILAAQEGEYAKSYGDRHPLIIEVRGKLAALHARMESEMERVEQSLRLAALAARTREKELREAIARQEEEFAGRSHEEARLRDLERTAAADRTLLESLQARSRELGAEALFSQPNARVVAQARPPLEPTGLSKMVLLGLTGPGAIFIGVAVAFVTVLFDRRPRRPGEIEFGTGLAVVAAIPRLSGRARQLLVSREHRVLDLIEETAHGRAPCSLIFGAMLDLYANLLAKGEGEVGTVLFTSSVPTEGKTSAAVTFARLLAYQGHRVLLIDCDLRRPSVHRRLGLPDWPGLGECLAGTATIAEAVRRDTSGLCFLPAGVTFIDVGELAPGGKFCKLVDAARAEHSIVVIDSAPVLTAAETRLLAGMADRTVFLVRWEHTPVETVRRALRLLAENGARLSGITLSMVRQRDMAYYGYSGRYARPNKPGEGA